MLAVGTPSNRHAWQVRAERLRVEGVFTRLAAVMSVADVEACWGRWVQAVAAGRLEAKVEDEEAGRLAAEERWKAAEEARQDLQVP